LTAAGKHASESDRRADAGSSAASVTVDANVGVRIQNDRPGLRTRLLATWTKGGTSLTPVRKRLFDALAAALDREYYAAETSTARREEIKRLCMGEYSGVAWAKAYLERGFPDRFTPVLAMFGELERRLASGVVPVSGTEARKIRSVHQVACCSGREIAYFAKRHPEVRFCGSDADPAVVEFLRHHWRDVPNLSFEVLRLECPDEPSFAALGSDLAYASGGLHYLDAASLRGFLGQARDLVGSLLLSQPLDASFSSDGPPLSTPRRLLSWNHAYAAYLAEAGWTGIGWRESSVAELPGVKNIGAWATAL
jgi:hypothetical protein